MQAVGNYVAAGRQDGEDSAAVPLVEDALKMPFTGACFCFHLNRVISRTLKTKSEIAYCNYTVFTTAHKKKFLKMLEKCTGVVPSATHLSGEDNRRAEEAEETALQVGGGTAALAGGACSISYWIY